MTSCKLQRSRHQHLSPSLGREVSYRTYASDCRLLLPGGRVNWGVLRATVIDEFVLAHTLGWWAKVRGFGFRPTACQAAACARHGVSWQQPPLITCVINQRLQFCRRSCCATG